MPIIRVKEDTKERLNGLGGMLDTYDIIVRRLLDEHAHYKASNTPRRRAPRHQEEVTTSPKE